MGSRGFFSRTSPMRDKRRGQHNRMSVLDEEVHEGLADFRTCEFLGSHSLSSKCSGGIIPMEGRPEGNGRYRDRAHSQYKFNFDLNLIESCFQHHILVDLLALSVHKNPNSPQSIRECARFASREETTRHEGRKYFLGICKT